MLLTAVRMILRVKQHAPASSTTLKLGFPMASVSPLWLVVQGWGEVYTLTTGHSVPDYLLKMGSQTQQRILYT